MHALLLALFVIVSGGGLSGPPVDHSVSHGDDPVEEARELRARALDTVDYDLAVQAVVLTRNATSHERLATLFTLEHTLRLRGLTATADSVVLAACQSDCHWLTEAPEVLYAAVATEVVDPAGPRVMWRAVRAMLASDIPYPLVNRLTLPLSALSDVERAADVADAKADYGLAAELWHAFAHLSLPRRRSARDTDADRSLEAARHALHFRTLGKDPGGEARTRSLMALAQVRSDPSAGLDSTRRLIEQAERLAASVPANVRALILKRSAIIAAATGDDVRSEQLIEEAVSMLGEHRTRDLEGHFRSTVALELVGAGSADAALRQSTRAHSLLRNSNLPEDILARATLTHSEAHRLNTHVDSTINYFEAAAHEFKRIGDVSRAVSAFLAAAEHAFEHNRHDAIGDLLGNATAILERWPGDSAVLQAWPYDHTNLIARMLNMAGMAVFVEGGWDDALSAFTGARQIAPPSHSEWYESERALQFLELAQNGDLGANWSPPDPKNWNAGATPGLASNEPPRARHRPLTDGLWYAYIAMRHAQRGDLDSGFENAIEARRHLSQAGHQPSIRRGHGITGLLFAQLGRRDSAEVYLALAGDMAPDDLKAYLMRADPVHETETDSPRQFLATLTPEEGRRALYRLLDRSRSQRDVLGEARALDALGHWHLRHRHPPDPATASAYLDSAAVALRSIRQDRLEDWQRVQLAEQFAPLHADATLAWLARADEIGLRAASMAALAAADRGRSVGFEWIAGLRGHFLRDAVFNPFESPLVSDLAEVGERLLDFPIGFWGRHEIDYAHTVLVYHQAADTLVAWLHVGGLGRLEPALEIARVPITPEDLGALVGQLRAALGVGAEAATSFDNLEPDPLGRGFGGGAPSARPVEDVLREVSDLLFPPELLKAFPSNGELIIVPHGPITSVPFAALPVGPAGQPLGTTHDIRYLPSVGAAQWQYRYEDPDHQPLHRVSTNPGERKAWLKRAIVVGNPTMPTLRTGQGNEIELEDLPGARAEAEGIAEMLGARPLLEADATLARVRASVADATILHLATHGYAFGSEARVGDSFIALAPGEGHDGVFTVDQLLADPEFRLTKADLVVLSACQTGLGLLTATEGTLGLQRAFLARGARSVLTTLWNVDDQATATLTQSFYRHWLNGNHKAEALRRAQLELRGLPDSPYHHPRYWAAFQLVGQK